MAYQSLILGVLFSIGIFAVKSGAGISYVLAVQKKKRAGVAAFFLFALVYGVVFAGAAVLLKRIDPVRHLAAIQTFIQSGMIIHLVMAGLLVIWGLRLLTQPPASRTRSRAWVMLAVPCPVCITVIFFSAGFLITCFPDIPALAVLALYCAFMLVNLVTLEVMFLYRHQRPMAPESFLGGAMLLMAAYFILSVTIMPQFAEMENIYRLAMHHDQTHSQKVIHLVPFSILTAAAFIGGVAVKSITIRSTP
ncbi:MAG: DUF2162 family putative transporter [Desulfobacterales bacterium]|jgi:predicted transporter|nr:DUF2162 family putative transporter [Desulfobacterales bacterium]